ncbi:MAG: restriction endonuclease subunit S [Candidatus Scalinduaceae bacterium]
MRVLHLEDLVDNRPCSYGDDLGQHDHEFPVVKVSNIDGNGHFKNAFEERSFEHKNLKKLLAQEGDLLVVKSSGSKRNILSGKTALVDSELSNKIVSSNFLLRLVPKKEKVVSKYLWYLLNSPFSHNFIKTIVGTTTYPNLKWELYSKHPVPYVEVPRQQQIVQILDTAESLCEKRKEQLNLFDYYLESVFLEMFGDPVINDKEWETTYLGSVIDSIESGWSPVCLDTQRQLNEIPVILKLGAVTYCYFNPKNHKVIPTNIKIEKKVEVKKQDLLFTRKNTKELVAASAFVFDCKRNLLLPDTIFRLNYKKELVNGIFLWKLLVEKGFRRVIQNLATGSAGSMPNISKEKLRRLLIPFPPIELQNKFASVVEQVEQTKQKMRASLDEMDNHFNALMQRHFG